jgi:hypothetical protein
VIHHGAGPAEPTIEEIHVTKERGLEMKARHPLFIRLAEEACDLLDATGGVNYVEFRMNCAKHGEIIVLIQKASGETPAQQNVRLKKELETAPALPLKAVSAAWCPVCGLSVFVDRPGIDLGGGVNLCPKVGCDGVLRSSPPGWQIAVKPPEGWGRGERGKK